MTNKFMIKIIFVMLLLLFFGLDSYSVTRRKVSMNFKLNIPSCVIPKCCNNKNSKPQQNICTACSPTNTNSK